jgi:hypothetical protein
MVTEAEVKLKFEKIKGLDIFKGKIEKINVALKPSIVGDYVIWRATIAFRMKVRYIDTTIIDVLNGNFCAAIGATKESLHILPADIIVFNDCLKVELGIREKIGGN